MVRRSKEILPFLKLIHAFLLFNPLSIQLVSASFYLPHFGMQKSTFTFESPFSAPNQACGPEARALRGKSIGGERILPGDPARVPQNGAGRSGARPGAPTAENSGSWRKNGLPARSKI